MARGDYGRIRHTFWTDPDVKPLTVEEKALLLYYATSPHSNMIGLYHCPPGYVAVETGVPVEDVVAALGGPLEPFVSFDPRTDEVLVHRAAKHNIGETLKLDDKRTKGVNTLLAAAHSGWLVEKFVGLYPDWPIEAPSGDSEAPLKPPGKPLRSHSSSSSSSIAVAGSSEDESSGDGPREFSTTEPEQPEADEPIGKTLAPAIREHLWLTDSSTPPPALLDAEPKWTMGRELTVARQLMKSEGLSGADMLDIVTVFREALEVPKDRPASLLWLNKDGRRDRLNICRTAVQRKQANPEAVGDALRRLGA